MRKPLLLALALAFALLVLNWAPALDALAYRPVVTQARQMLPDGWRGITHPDAELRIAALEAAQTPAQRAAMAAASARFRTGSSGVILAIPRGLETEELSLETGCFRFARREVNIIVWHFSVPISCL